MARQSSKPTSFYTHKNTVQLVRCGEPYFTKLIQLIDQAKHTIHLQVYIFEEDSTGLTVGEALINAARRGVAVYLLADGYASDNLSHQFINKLRSAGVNFRFFEPLLKSEHFYFGRRLHHKVMVADSYYSLVGGINISDRYNDLENQPAWLDFALYAEGEVAAELMKLCISIWNRPGQLKEQKAILPDPPVQKPATNCMVRIRRNDWVKKRDQVSSSYIEMLHKASSHVIIMSSYFIPGRKIRQQISRAARRGINIRVVVTGQSDVKLVKYAERYMYRWLLNRNILLYEYIPNVLHAKLAIRDNHFVTVGSYNVNDLSAYASIELNLDVFNEAFAKTVQQQLETIIEKDCKQITEKNYLARYNLFQRLLQYISYLITRVVLFLFTFYFRQE